MKKSLLALLAALCSSAFAQTVSSPDGKLSVSLSMSGEGQPQYTVTYNGAVVIENSLLGLNTSIGDFTKGLEQLKVGEVKQVTDSYSLPNAKFSQCSYTANELSVSYGLANDANKDTRAANNDARWEVTFHVDNNNVAFRYQIFTYKNPRRDERKACLVNSEATEYVLPQGTTTFICPQMTPQTGFARTAPSYETFYEYDGEMGKNGQGRGYTFPALFKVNGESPIWVMLCETNVGGNYCGSRLECKGNHYQIAYPEMSEFGGVGNVEPGIMLPGYTPWRTITVGNTLAPITETTIMWDLVEPQYAASQEYKYGKSTWSWVIRMDASCNYDEQKEYIDLAADLGWQYVLIDAWWDTNIGYERMAELSKYAATKGIGIFLWYNSNGYWNDAMQGPRGKMHRMIDRRKEMAWLQKAGIKGLKVDFIGSDKQQTMQMYEDILADANDYGLMIIFHGCTIPRGWERMYPNFVACEAARVSENLAFGQRDNDMEAIAATILPVLRNSIGNMDFGGSTLNKYYSKGNNRGTHRVTSDVYALATAIAFQTPVQNFALTPNNLTDAPAWAVDFMKKVPTTWEEVKFIDGYPGKYLVIARKSEGKWYVAGINATAEPMKLKLTLPMFTDKQPIQLYLNNELKSSKMGKKQTLQVEMPSNGGFVVTE